MRRALKRPLRPCRISEFFSLRTPLIQGTKKVLSDAQAGAGYHRGLFCGGSGKGESFVTFAATTGRRPHGCPACSFVEQS